MICFALVLRHIGFRSVRQFAPILIHFFVESGINLLKSGSVRSKNALIKTTKR